MHARGRRPCGRCARCHACLPASKECCWTHPNKPFGLAAHVCFYRGLNRVCLCERCRHCGPLERAPSEHTTVPKRLQPLLFVPRAAQCNRDLQRLTAPAVCAQCRPVQQGLTTACSPCCLCPVPPSATGTYNGLQPLLFVPSAAQCNKDLQRLAAPAVCAQCRPVQQGLITACMPILLHLKSENTMCVLACACLPCGCPACYHAHLPFAQLPLASSPFAASCCG